MADQNFRVNPGLEVGIGGTILTALESGKIGIGTTNPKFQLEISNVGSSGTALYVDGNARITGILSIGQGTVTIDGSNNTVTASNIIVANLTAPGGVGYATTGYVTNALVGYATQGYVTNSLVGYATQGYVTQQIGVGIQSAGISIATTAKTLNFIGAGNTFNVVGDRVDISIQGGGGTGLSSTGILTCRAISNSAKIMQTLELNDTYNQGTNYAMIGPIEVSVGSTVTVGTGVSFVII